MPNNPPEYPPEQWATDLYDFQRLAGAESASTARKMMDDFLYRKYPDAPAAAPYGLRLLAAHLWILRHCHELDLPDVAVVGSSQFSITIHLAYALYRVWMAIPDDKVSFDPDVKSLVEMAREQARLNEPPP
jgi:hypothetical protein